ncbi:hypothetical protein LEP1GSC116_0660 [Leptospira interrogans serovar Icterohaemorrhagiae str. Verdun HP]|uniref:Uncharacterized protein n=1 Tax=Leptospira interrogans serovar Icterohaemorrhagiae str. Verdun HP TaxID=1049910 RepID=M6RM71_LEPIR|nr:hypothetical protein LEP1GSC116_0660 [Leptospira interrogans serovar Icterohaemorrhagiae str. Verdun HP]
MFEGIFSIACFSSNIALRIRMSIYSIRIEIVSRSRIHSISKFRLCILRGKTDIKYEICSSFNHSITVQSHDSIGSSAGCVTTHNSTVYILYFKRILQARSSLRITFIPFTSVQHLST